jgi:hypothetical protein
MATLVLLFLLIFSSHVSAEWTYLTEHKNGQTYYIDYHKTEKTDNEIYFWVLTNNLEPSKEGTLSSITYRKSDCSVPRKQMILSFMTYDQHFGEGNNLVSYNPGIEWIYPNPESVTEFIINTMCEFYSY